MTNREISTYARKFLIGCSADDDCSECLLEGKLCESLGNNENLEKAFFKFLNKYNISNKTIVNQYGKNSTTIKNVGTLNL